MPMVNVTAVEVVLIPKRLLKSKRNSVEETLNVKVAMVRLV
jgi:hypothetical protein